jgi:hypothetical protein
VGFTRVSSQTYLKTLNINMYGIDGRLSNNTKGKSVNQTPKRRECLFRETENQTDE